MKTKLCLSLLCSFVLLIGLGCSRPESLPFKEGDLVVTVVGNQTGQVVQATMAGDFYVSFFIEHVGFKGKVCRACELKLLPKSTKSLEK